MKIEVSKLKKMVLAIILLILSCVFTAGLIIADFEIKKKIEEYRIEN